jgi:hypothetical protein
MPAGSVRITDRIDLGVLTCEIPPDLVDEVVTAAGAQERRNRLLPARMMVYFVLALCLCPGSDSLCPPGYRAVLRELTRGLRGIGQYALASSSALTQARRRLGDTVMTLLFERVRGPLAAPAASWAHAFGLRLVAWVGSC